MAKAIFTKRFNFTDPKIGTSWRIDPSETPQSFPQRIIDAAIAAGAAETLPDGGKATPAEADKREG